MTNEELAKHALELAENATPGPWEFDLAKCGIKDADGQPVGSICWDEDATFIAEARTLVPLLAKRLLEAEEELRVSRTTINNLHAEHRRITRNMWGIVIKGNDD